MPSRLRIPTTRQWPQWQNQEDPSINLRYVGPNLLVGAYRAPAEYRGYSAIIDFYGKGSSYDEYPKDASILKLAFEDGDTFPPGALDAVCAFVTAHRGKGPVLLHCAAGLSRSASAAYAMLRVLDGLDHADALERVKTETNPEYPMTRTLNSARGWVQRQG